MNYVRNIIAVCAERAERHLKGKRALSIGLMTSIILASLYFPFLSNAMECYIQERIEGYGYKNDKKEINRGHLKPGA